MDGRDLYRHRLAGDAIYRAAYQRELAIGAELDWLADDGRERTPRLVKWAGRPLW